MVRLTRRESALSMLAGAPLNHAVTVPEKRTRSSSTNLEWPLQRDCVKACREKELLDRDFFFMAPGAAQNNLTPKQRAFAVMMGWRRGIADIWLFRRVNGIKLGIVELKRPPDAKNGSAKLTPEQQQLFAWFMQARIACARVDNLREFCRILDAF